MVSAAVLVDTMFYAAIAPLLPAYQDDLGLSKTAAGVLSASYAAGTLLAALPAGWLAGRVGAKPTMLAGLALLSGSSLVFGLAESIVLLDASRFVQGVGGACSWAGGLAWLLAVAPRERRGELIGTALGAAIFGVLLGPVLGGAAIGDQPAAGLQRRRRARRGAVRVGAVHPRRAPRGAGHLVGASARRCAAVRSRRRCGC